MKVKSIPSSWISRDGLRLDCNPYMSGALEARIRLEELSCRKQRLADLTRGHNGGIYNGPQFVRNFVDDPCHGVPFLGTSSMLRADLSNLPFLKKKDAQSSKLNYLKIEPGMTLISCSGTIGRMVYARPDMDGMWSNQDILKVAPIRRKFHLATFMHSWRASMAYR
jgi:type I restriction enzyme S subunit